MNHWYCSHFSAHMFFDILHFSFLQQPTLSDMTQYELNFSLLVEQMLSKIIDPAYRQIIVEVSILWPQHGQVIICLVKCEMKLLIHSQTSMVQFHLTLENGCNCLPMLGFKLHGVRKRGPWCYINWTTFETYCSQNFCSYFHALSSFYEW